MTNENFFVLLLRVSRGITLLSLHLVDKDKSIKHAYDLLLRTVHIIAAPPLYPDFILPLHPVHTGIFLSPHLAHNDNRQDRLLPLFILYIWIFALPSHPVHILLPFFIEYCPLLLLLIQITALHLRCISLESQYA